jgi:hypothetical protein
MRAGLGEQRLPHNSFTYSTPHQFSAIDEGAVPFGERAPEVLNDPAAGALTLTGVPMSAAVASMSPRRWAAKRSPKRRRLSSLAASSGDKVLAGMLASLVLKMIPEFETGRAGDNLDGFM